VDERDLNARSRRARVLRAADVIPPFDREDSRPSKGDRKGDQSGLSKPGDAGADGAGHGADQAGSPGAAANPARRPPSKPSEIPAYDLAENILAEHRRTAAGRRAARTADRSLHLRVLARSLLPRGNHQARSWSSNGSSRRLSPGISNASARGRADNAGWHSTSSATRGIRASRITYEHGYTKGGALPREPLLSVSGGVNPRSAPAILARFAGG
jgi:hypothetical protein